MFSKSSSNVIYAKAKARYGKSLSPGDYRRLLSCESVSDVAKYLAGLPAYSKTLKNIESMGEIHRGHLEDLLRNHLIEDYFSLCKYELSMDSSVVDFIVIQMEIQQLMSLAFHLGSGNIGSHFFGVSQLINSKSKLNWEAVPKINSYEDFLDFIKDSDYYPIFNYQSDKRDSSPPYLRIETDLYKYLYNSILKNRPKYQHESVSKLLLLQIEWLNIIKIYRAKEYYKYDNDKIRRLILPYAHKLNKSSIEGMLSAENADQALEVLRESRYGDEIKKYNFVSIDRLADNIIFASAHKNLYFSMDVSIILVSYIVLKKYEYENIINIIEGIRYGLRTEEIEKLLIGRWK